MEAVGIAASIAGLVQVAQQCIKILKKHIGPSEFDSSETKHLFDTIRQFLAAAGGFRAVIEASSEDEDKSNRIGRLAEVMRICRMALEQIAAFEHEGRFKKLIKGVPFDKNLKQMIRELGAAKELLNLAICADQHIIISETNKYLHQMGETVEDVLGNVQGAAERIDDINARLQSQQNLKQKQEILDWISTRTFAPVQTDLLNRLQAGTGKWFLESEPFQTWHSSTDENHQMLFGPGNLGSGKTMITSAVIDHLHQKHKDQADTAISYVYCNYKNRETDDSTSLLRCLLRQIINALPSVPKKLIEMHGINEDLTLGTVSKLLQEAASKCSRCFILIDALDEFQHSSYQGCISLLSEIAKVRAYAKVFATSRPIPRICSFFDGCLSQEIRATREDLETYLESRVSCSSRIMEKNQVIRDEVKVTIISAVNGMFLLAQLYLNLFDGILTVQEAKKKLNFLKETTAKARRSGVNDNGCEYDLLGHAYDDSMLRIRAKKREH